MRVKRAYSVSLAALKLELRATRLLKKFFVWERLLRKEKQKIESKHIKIKQNENDYSNSPRQNKTALVARRQLSCHAVKENDNYI